MVIRLRNWMEIIHFFESILKRYVAYAFSAFALPCRLLLTRISVRRGDGTFFVRRGDGTFLAIVLFLLLGNYRAVAKCEVDPGKSFANIDDDEEEQHVGAIIRVCRQNFGEGLDYSSINVQAKEINDLHAEIKKDIDDALKSTSASLDCDGAKTSYQNKLNSYIDLAKKFRDTRNVIESNPSHFCQPFANNSNSSNECTKAASQIASELTKHEADIQKAEDYIESCKNNFGVKGEFRSLRQNINESKKHYDRIDKFRSDLSSVNSVQSCNASFSSLQNEMNCNPATSSNYCANLSKLESYASAISTETQTLDPKQCQESADSVKEGDYDLPDDGADVKDVLMPCSKIPSININQQFPFYCKEQISDFPKVQQVSYQNMLSLAKTNRIICNGKDEVFRLNNQSNPRLGGTYIVNKEMREAMMETYYQKFLPICAGMHRLYLYNVEKHKDLAVEFSQNPNPDQAPQTNHDPDWQKNVSKIQCKATLYVQDYGACKYAKALMMQYAALKIYQTVGTDIAMQKVVNKQLGETQKAIDQKEDLTEKSFDNNIQLQEKILELAKWEENMIYTLAPQFVTATLAWPGTNTAKNRCLGTVVRGAINPLTNIQGGGCTEVVENGSTLPFIFPNEQVRGILIKSTIELATLYKALMDKKNKANQSKNELSSQLADYKESLIQPPTTSTSGDTTGGGPAVNCANYPYLPGCQNTTTSGGPAPGGITAGSGYGGPPPTDNGDNTGGPTAPGGGNTPDDQKQASTWEDGGATSGGAGGASAGQAGASGSGGGGDASAGGTGPSDAEKPDANVADKSAAGGSGSILERSANYGRRNGGASFSSGPGSGNSGLGARGRDNGNPFDNMFKDKNGDNRGGIHGADGADALDRSIAEAGDDDKLGYSNLFERISKTAGTYFQKGRVGKAKK